jgi:IMP dehydrogenase
MIEQLEIGLRILGDIVLIGVNAYFVAIEFALTRLRQYPESEFNTPGLELAWEMTDDLELYSAISE